MPIVWALIIIVVVSLIWFAAYIVWQKTHDKVTGESEIDIELFKVFKLKIHLGKNNGKKDG